MTVQLINWLVTAYYRTHFNSFNKELGTFKQKITFYLTMLKISNFTLLTL